MVFKYKRNVKKDREFVTSLITNYGNFFHTAAELNTFPQAVYRKAIFFYEQYPILEKIIDKLHEKGIVKRNGSFISNKVIIATYIENYSVLNHASKALGINHITLKKKIDQLYSTISKLREVAEIGKKTIIVNGKKRYFSDKTIKDAYYSNNQFLNKAAGQLGIKNYQTYKYRLNKILKR